jgi:hypothetical protein
LERNQDGKFAIDKEKMVEKKEIEFEKKTENLVEEELKKQKGSANTSMSSTTTPSSDKSF